MKLGLTDYERAELDQARRTRNCLIAITLCILAVGLIAAH